MGRWAGRGPGSPGCQDPEPSPTLPPQPTHVYLHDPVPVVASGDLEEREEGHAEVLEGGVPAHALTRVLVIAHWKESGVSPGRPALLPLGLISESPRQPQRCVRTVPSPQVERLRLEEVAHKLGLKFR